MAFLMSVKKLDVTGSFKDGYEVDHQESFYYAPIARNRYETLIENKSFAKHELKVILQLMGNWYDINDIVYVDINGSDFGHWIYDIVFLDRNEKPIFAMDFYLKNFR